MLFIIKWPNCGIKSANVFNTIGFLCGAILNPLIGKYLHPNLSICPHFINNNFVSQQYLTVPAIPSNLSFGWQVSGAINDSNITDLLDSGWSVPYSHRIFLNCNNIY